MAEEEINPPDRVTLYRMVWHPDCYHNGELTSSGAFPRQDLNGVRFVSVDRNDLFNEETAIQRAKEQQQKADGQTTFREEARIIDLPCGPVRGLVDNAGVHPFEVTSEEEVTNPAHCGIWNTSGKKSRAYINEIRAKLMRLRMREWTLKF